MPTRTFTRAELEALDVTCENVHSVVIDEGRWSNTTAVVFAHEGAHYRVTYDDPATEMQEGQDIWGGRDQVEAIEVVPRSVVTMRWKPAHDKATTAGRVEADDIARAIARLLLGAPAMDTAVTGPMVSGTYTTGDGAVTPWYAGVVLGTPPPATT